MLSVFFILEVPINSPTQSPLETVLLLSTASVD